jgi:heat shock protein HtpX
MPEVWIYNDEEPNAFATWMTKNNSLVAVSTWLLESMENDAIEWVIWHEMSHIINWDMVTMTLLQWILNTFVIFFARIVSNIISNALDEKLSRLAYFTINIILQIVFWLLASLIAMKFSRNREFKADAGSAIFVWKEKMIAWLKALKNAQMITSYDKSNLATMKISNKKRTWIFSLLSSHPDLDTRINALEKLSI